MASGTYKRSSSERISPPWSRAGREESVGERASARDEITTSDTKAPSAAARASEVETKREEWQTTLGGAEAKSD